MNNATGKRLLALVRNGDYAHPGEEEAIRLLLAGVAPDPTRRILDAGCGGGGTAAWVQAHGYGTVTGIEIDAETSRLARARHPEIEVVTGDMQRATHVVDGPYDLIYTMTSLYAVADQRAALARLAALAAPGAELRLLEYADPSGGFAAAAVGNPRLAWWQPVASAGVRDLLAGSGWSPVESRDISERFAQWYDDLLQRIDAQAEAITRQFGREWYEFAAREYAVILALVRADDLGGIFVRATAP